MRKTLACLGLAAACFCNALAQSPDSARVASLYEQRSGGAKAERVTRTEWGWWEILTGGQIVYVNDAVDRVFVGQVFDATSRANLTENRLGELLKIDFKSLPTTDAVKLVRGKGTRAFATFEDPNCGFCKRLHTELAKLDDATIYVFLYPILSPDSTEKSKAIWCAKDPAQAFESWMLKGTVPPPVDASCKSPVDANVALGRKLGVRGTPTLFFVDGSRLPGAMPLAQIEQRLSLVAPR